MTEPTRNCFDRMAGESDKGANADQTVVSSERKVTDMKKNKERLRKKIRNKPKERKTFSKNIKAGAGKPLPEDDNRPIAQTNAPDLEVMSHVILDFAEPLLKTCNDDASQRKAISLGIYVWNTAMLPEPECSQILATYLAGCQEVMPPEEVKTLSGYIDQLVQTRKTRFADNRNKITNCTFGNFGADLNIEVGYTME